MPFNDRSESRPPLQVRPSPHSKPGLRDTINKQQEQIALQTKQLEEEKQTSIYDSLTGLINERQLKIEQNIFQHSRIPVAVLYGDVDNLKLINDKTSNHQIGDGLIIAAAQLLQSTFRDTDVVARPHGDEFIVLFSDVDLDESKIESVTSRINANLDALNEHRREQELPEISLSFGIKIAELDGNVYDVLGATVEADRLMYIQKQQKKLISI